MTGLPAGQRLEHALLGNAGAAVAAVDVGDGAGADDGARDQRARLRGVRDELREIEGHVDAGIWLVRTARR